MDNFSSLVSVLIQDEMRGIPHHERILEMGQTPEVLVTYAGFSKLDLVVKGKAISKMCFDHGISTPIIQRLPNLVINPKAIYLSASHPDSTVVFTFESHLGSPIIIPIHKDRSVGRSRVCNEILSMYGKQGPDPEAKWKRDGLLLWEP